MKQRMHYAGFFQHDPRLVERPALGHAAEVHLHRGLGQPDRPVFLIQLDSGEPDGRPDGVQFGLRRGPTGRIPVAKAP